MSAKSPIKPRFSIVLVEPQIAGNTGAIGRTCVALGIKLFLIRPYGFKLDEKALRRAGLDYWQHIDLQEFDSWQDFMMAELPEREQLLFFSSKSDSLYYHAPYHPQGYLVFGNETNGLPPGDHLRLLRQCLHPAHELGQSALPQSQ